MSHVHERVDLHVAFLLVLCMFCNEALGVNAKRNLTAEDVLNITWAVNPEVSPDGRQILYKVIETKNGKRLSTVWSSATTEGAARRQVLSEFRDVSQVRWSPDGKRFAFLASDRQSGQGKQLFVSSDTEATEVRCVTAMPNGLIDYRWSADSAVFAFTADERPQKPTSVLVVGSGAPRVALWATGLGETKPRRVSADDQHIVDFAWSPDSKHFAAMVAKSEPIDGVVLPTSLVILRRTDGVTLRTLSEDATGGCSISWSPDGKTIAAPVYAPRKLSRRLALMPAGGGEPEFPFSEFKATPIGRVEWTADSRHLFVRFLEKTRNKLVRLNIQTKKPDYVSDELTNFWDYAINRDGTTLAFNAESQHDPPDIVVKRNGRLHRLTDFNPELKAFALGKVETVHWNSSLDDRTVYGVLITPPEYEPGTPCPTIVNLHSGPHWLWWEGWIGTYMSWGQFLASKGYAVFLPNHRGSIGQGWEFAEEHYLEWGRADYQDVMDGVNWLVKQGIADPNRLAIGGSSFGGYLAAWASTQSHRFRASVIEAGWTDLISANLTTDAPGPLRVFLNGNELERGDFYRSRSPLTFVKQCNTPTLILHGQLDRRVPIGQGWSFYRALKLCGVQSEMVVYKNEGHGLTKRENQLDAMRRIRDWFDHHLKH